MQVSLLVVLILLLMSRLITKLLLLIELHPFIQLCRVLGSVRLGRSVSEGPFPKKRTGFFTTRQTI
jgi:hypothetical protein